MSFRFPFRVRVSVQFLSVVLVAFFVLSAPGCRKKTKSKELPAEGVHDLDMSDDATKGPDSPKPSTDLETKTDDPDAGEKSESGEKSSDDQSNDNVLGDDGEASSDLLAPESKDSSNGKQRGN